MWQYVLVGLGILMLAWLGFLAFMVIARPNRDTLKQLRRLLPDTTRLIRRLATDPTIPRSARIPVWGLLAYLAMPLDLVPDFIPMIGYADDVILVAFVLRRLLRRSDPARVLEHWPGSPESFASLQGILGLQSS